MDGVLNVTVPAGVPADELTVAVKVTLCPMALGFCEETRLTLVPALVTFWLTIGEVLAAELASPL